MTKAGVWFVGFMLTLAWASGFGAGQWWERGKNITASSSGLTLSSSGVISGTPKPTDESIELPPFVVRYELDYDALCARGISGKTVYIGKYAVAYWRDQIIPHYSECSVYEKGFGLRYWTNSEGNAFYYGRPKTAKGD